MTRAQKNIITNLLAGCSIYGTHRGFLLRGTENNFMLKVNPRTYRQVKRYLRKDKKTGFFVIDKREVRKEHGNTWIKQQYQKQVDK